MKELSESELVEIGRRAAAQVPGLGEVEGVHVSSRVNIEDELVYDFIFLIERGGDGSPLRRTRLGQRVRDELLAREDEHYPLVWITDREGWDRRRRA